MEQQPRDESRAATVREGGDETWSAAAELIDQPSNLPTAVGSRTPSGQPPTAENAAGRRRSTGQRGAGSTSPTAGGGKVDAESPGGSDFSSSAAPAGVGSNTPVGAELSGFQQWDARQAGPGSAPSSSYGSGQVAMTSPSTLGGLAGALAFAGIVYAWWRRRQARRSRAERMKAALLAFGASTGGELPRLIGQAAAQSRSAWLPLLLLPIGLWLRERGKAGEQASAQLLEPLNLEGRSERLVRQGTEMLDQYRRRLVREIDPNQHRGMGWTPWLLGGAAVAGGYLAYQKGWISGVIGGSDHATSASRTLVRDVMTRGAETVNPDATIAEAARRMRDLDIGSLPVTDGSRLVGIVTDRDLSVRATAAGKDPSSTHVRDVMSPELAWIFEDEPADAAAKVMRERQIRRLPVLDRSDRLVGMVALADLATDLGDDRLKGETLEDISQPASSGAR